jgi:hypothetical protein
MAPRGGRGSWSLRLACVAVALALVGCAGDPGLGSGDLATADETDDGGATDPAGDDASTQPMADGDASDGDAASGDGPGVDVCALLTVEEVSGLLGSAARVDDSGAAVVAGADCTWIADEVGLEQLHLQTFTSSSYYAADAWGGPSEPLDGPGDEAFVVRTGPLGATAGYREGDRVVLLNLQQLVGGGSRTAGDRADEVAGMLATIHDRDGA